ncbi:hypothetical protein Q4560_17670 [Celeribacter halophilus]|uniref:Hint domain-containing protein n=1 Tax=Celeribacter halophilus TaxID=576117 RepID=A0AAW7XWI7_9RHOB|nr:hypothetical protein [Celeribacter halophilus]MDO6458669.1 hypothetical protein [Celeribacter halophilus]MDO6725099.1 hypothetical protein [Celeribacter halophilus]
MKHHEAHQFSDRGDAKGYFLTGLRPFSIINTGGRHMAASDIRTGMKIQLNDGRQSTVLSVRAYLTDVPRVNASTELGETSLCSEAYLSCSHALCELYFGSSEVAFPVKSIVGHDPAFSWQASTGFSECVALELDAFGWLQIDDLNVFLPPLPSDDAHGLWDRNRTPDVHDDLLYIPPQDRLLLSSEETLVLSSFNCTFADCTPPPRVNSRYASGLQGGAR